MDERALIDAFAELADPPAEGFDVTAYAEEFVRHCTELLEVDGVGVGLVDGDGVLRVLAASCERVRAVAAAQWLHREGPGPEAFRSGVVVGHDDLGAASDRWPRFATGALGAGFASVRAVPMVLRADVIGVLTLFRVGRGPVDRSTLTTARSLASMATIGLAHERRIRQAHDRTEQLQAALTSRLVIELAKGILIGRLGVDAAGAFEILRGHARRNNLKIGSVAATVVANRSDAQPLKVEGNHRSRAPRHRVPSPDTALSP